MNKKRLHNTYLATIIISLITATAFYSAENKKKDFIKYHDTGQYDKDISDTTKDAACYIKFRLTQNNRTSHQQKLAVVMDIDETALSNYDKLVNVNFKTTAATLEKIKTTGDGKAIHQTLALYNYLKDHGIAIFFITNRDQATQEQTILNLNKAGFHNWDGILFKNKENATDIESYQISKRKQIIDNGYDIIANIGNHTSTLNGGFADMIFKLPNPFY